MASAAESAARLVLVSYRVQHPTRPKGYVKTYWKKKKKHEPESLSGSGRLLPHLLPSQYPENLIAGYPYAAFCEPRPSRDTDAASQNIIRAPTPKWVGWAVTGSSPADGRFLTAGGFVSGWTLRKSHTTRRDDFSGGHLHRT